MKSQDYTVCTFITLNYSFEHLRHVYVKFYGDFHENSVSRFSVTTLFVTDYGLICNCFYS
jgi:hypothetical protein